MEYKFLINKKVIRKKIKILDYIYYLELLLIN